MNRMSGLVRTDDSMGIVSLDHLIENNNQTDGKSSISLKFGALKTGSTRHFISTSDHPLVVRLNQYFLQHPEDLVNTIKEGVERAAQGGYVMLMESSNAEYVANSMCQMRVLYDTVNMRQGFGYGSVSQSVGRDPVLGRRKIQLGRGTNCKKMFCFIL